jgi:uncharacterized protein (DUF4415 family)
MKKKSTSRDSGTGETDWERIDAMTDEDIDFSDSPEATPEMLAQGVVRKNFKVLPRKKQLTLLIDSDVLWWYQKQGRGYQSRINSLLRAYMEQHVNKPA